MCVTSGNMTRLTSNLNENQVGTFYRHSLSKSFQNLSVFSDRCERFPPGSSSPWTSADRKRMIWYLLRMRAPFYSKGLCTCEQNIWTLLGRRRQRREMFLAEQRDVGQTEMCRGTLLHRRGHLQHWRRGDIEAT